MYQFTEDCRIGIPEIDEEHKKLFQMVNEAFALLAEPSATVVGVKNLVLALKKYAATHFIHEEAYMDEIKDPELPRQKKEHEQFKEKVNEVDLEALNDENGKEVLTELLEFLSRWLYHHILGSDTMIGKMPALDEEEDPFAFTEKYKLGVELIDSEHQRLFEIIRETNELTNDVLFNDKYDDIKKIISHPTCSLPKRSIIIAQSKLHTMITKANELQLFVKNLFVSTEITFLQIVNIQNIYGQIIVRILLTYGYNERSYLVLIHENWRITA